jgi:Ion channel
MSPAELTVRVIAAILAVGIIAAILWDAFEALILPRRVTRTPRPTRFFYRSTWRTWKATARLIRPVGRRETYLSFFGPLSLLVLIGLWATCLLIGFGTLQWALGARVNVGYGPVTYSTALYLSGTTFFTLGLSDVVPLGAVSRAITVVEAGLGFGFLAVVVGYLPMLYQAFSRREVSISLLDARAGSPPSAGELLRRRDGHWPGDRPATCWAWRRGRGARAQRRARRQDGAGDPKRWGEGAFRRRRSFRCRRRAPVGRRGGPGRHSDQQCRRL